MEPPKLDDAIAAPEHGAGLSAVVAALDDVALFRRPWRWKSWVAASVGFLVCAAGFAAADEQTPRFAAAMAVVFAPFVWLAWMLSVDSGRFGSRRRKLWWTLATWLVAFVAAGTVAGMLTIDEGRDRLGLEHAEDASYLDGASPAPVPAAGPADDAR